MTTAEIATWCGVGVAFSAMMATQVAQWVRTSNAIAVNARRLDIMERWQQERSIDRSELLAVEAAAKADCAALGERLHLEIHDIETRVQTVAGKTEEISKTLNDVRLEIARIPEQIKRQEEVQALHHEALRHSLANLKMMMQNFLPKSAERA